MKRATTTWLAALALLAGCQADRYHAGHWAIDGTRLVAPYEEEEGEVRLHGLEAFSWQHDGEELLPVEFEEVQALTARRFLARRPGQEQFELIDLDAGGGPEETPWHRLHPRKGYLVGEGYGDVSLVRPDGSRGWSYGRGDLVDLRPPWDLLLQPLDRSGSYAEVFLLLRKDGGLVGHSLATGAAAWTHPGVAGARVEAADITVGDHVVAVRQDGAGVDLLDLKGTVLFRRVPEPFERWLVPGPSARPLHVATRVAGAAGDYHLIAPDGQPLSDGERPLVVRPFFVHGVRPGGALDDGFGGRINAAQAETGWSVGAFFVRQGDDEHARWGLVGGDGAPLAPPVFTDVRVDLCEGSSSTVRDYRKVYAGRLPDGQWAIVRVTGATERIGPDLEALHRQVVLDRHEQIARDEVALFVAAVGRASELAASTASPTSAGQACFAALRALELAGARHPGADARAAMRRALELLRDLHAGSFARCDLASTCADELAERDPACEDLARHFRAVRHERQLLEAREAAEAARRAAERDAEREADARRGAAFTPSSGGRFDDGSRALRREQSDWNARISQRVFEQQQAAWNSYFDRRFR